MKLRHPQSRIAGGYENGSVLIIVLWVCIGLVSIALYFANSMTFELRASDNRLNGIAADQAIEGAQRYISYVLENFATNGAVPDSSQFKCEAVEVGDAKFWLIGRDLSAENSTEPVFGLVDENGKFNLNTVTTNALSYLPGMTEDFAEAITDWRSTNGSLSLDYSSLGYAPKYAPFESVDELRLVSGASVDLLAGEDINRNGVLDKNEKDANANGVLDSGLFEYVTAWTREPNFHSDGTTLTNVNTADIAGLTALIRDNNAGNATDRAGRISGRVKGSGPNPTPNPFKGLFDFAAYWRGQGWSADDFAKIANDTTTSTNLYFYNRVNVNTASEAVLTSLFIGLNVDEQTAQSAAQTLITYREQNAGYLNSVAWVSDALGNNSVVTALRNGDYITTRSFQFTADIAATGAYGRGWRRVKFIFDTSDGTPKIIYRQDLSRLGWALGEKARETLLAKNTQ
jgi:type II secretory pathway component PulK